jgi:hypothetical protein
VFQNQGLILCGDLGSPEADKDLLHTNSIKRRANRLASSRLGLVQGVELSKHLGQGWYQAWNRAHGGGGEEVKKGGGTRRGHVCCTKHVFITLSLVLWSPSPHSTSVP